jgi:signal transduction histidine kinase
MRVSELLRPPRSVLLLLLAVLFVPAVALGWLSWRLLEQDRALAAQRLQERLEHAADLAAGAADRYLQEIDLRLSTPPDEARAPETGIFIRTRDGVFEAYPASRLLWQPAMLEPADSDWRVWEAGEALEFRRLDYAGARTAYARLAASPDARIRAGALMRLARVLRKSERQREALAVYVELARLGPVPVAGTPADLVARHEQAALLYQMSSDRKAPPDEARAVATALLTDLDASHWRIDRPGYLFYRDAARGWLDSDAPPPAAFALSAAAESAWHRLGTLPADAAQGRFALRAENASFFAVWRRVGDAVHAFVAPSSGIPAQWHNPALQPAVIVQVDAAAGPTTSGARAAQGPVAIRRDTDTGLPWTLLITSADPAADLAGLMTQRRLLLTGLALMALLVASGTYVIARAVGRELAVARLESDFVAAVSHEFRTPLTSMRHLTELLASGDIRAEERRAQYYTMLARETERLHRLVESLLDFGRMEAGRREYQLETIDVMTLVRDVVDEFRQGMTSRGVAFTATTGSAPALVTVDATAIGRAIWNLLDNAVKYAPGSAAIQIDATVTGRDVEIRVRDAGPGIPDHEQAAIFQRFVRGTAARTAHVAGTGLGLAMVQHIVTAHGGRVSVESAPGQGSAFTIALPCSGHEAAV